MTSTATNYFDHCVDEENIFRAEIAARKLVTSLARRLPSDFRQVFEARGGAGQALHLATTARDGLDHELAAMRQEMFDHLRRNYVAQTGASGFLDRVWPPRVTSRLWGEADKALLKAVYMRGNVFRGVLATAVELEDA